MVHIVRKQPCKKIFKKYLNSINENARLKLRKLVYFNILKTYFFYETVRQFILRWQRSVKKYRTNGRGGRPVGNT